MFLLGAISAAYVGIAVLIFSITALFISGLSPTNVDLAKLLAFSLFWPVTVPYVIIRS